MSEDRLNMFMAHQKEINVQNASTLEKLGNTIAKIEKYTSRIEVVERASQENSDCAKDFGKRITSLEHLSDFIKAARKMYSALLFAFIFGSCAAVWQVVKNDSKLKRTDVEFIINSILSNQTTAKNATD